jgi:hypothetical protein
MESQIWTAELVVVVAVVDVLVGAVCRPVWGEAQAASVTIAATSHIVLSLDWSMVNKAG